MRGGEPDGSFRRLARGGALVGAFESVVDGIADHVGERIGEELHHGLVDFRRLALGPEPHVLARGVRHLAHDPRHALEQRAHWLGADGHDAFLDLARQPLKLLEARRHLAVPHVARMQHALGEHGLVDDQLADEIDQPVDAVEVDADRRLHDGLDRLRRGIGLGCGSGGGNGGDGGRLLAHLAQDGGDVHLLGRRRCCFRLCRFDDEVAVALDEIEDLLHRGDRAFGFKPEFP